MPSTSEPRRELGSRMESRRRELRLRWQDVAEAGRVSLRALQSARTGEAEIRPLTQRGIEDGLQWPAGYIQDFLDGKNPVPPGPGGRMPAPASTEPEPATQPEPEPEPVSAAVASAISGLVDSLTPAIEVEVRRARLRMQRHDVTGQEVFADPHEQRIWDLELPESRRITIVAFLRAWNARNEAGADSGKFPRRNGQ